MTGPAGLPDPEGDRPMAESSLHDTTGCFGVRDAVHDYSGVVVLRGVDFELRSG